MQRALALVLVSIAAGCPKGVHSPDSATVVSVAELVARPSEFDGRPVRAIGYLAIGKPSFLFSSEGDRRHGIVRNAVVVELALVGHDGVFLPPAQAVSPIGPPSERPKRIQGIFQANGAVDDDTGSLGLLTEVEEVSEWGHFTSPRQTPRERSSAP